jgi:L-arabinose isomerase
MIKRRPSSQRQDSFMNDQLRVGLFGIGLEAYWPQFAGLLARLEGYVGTVAARLGRPGVEVVNLGLVDSPEKALAAGHAFRRADVDLILLYITTYAHSFTVLSAVRHAKCPVLIVNFQPTAALDNGQLNAMGDRTKTTGEWLAYGAACPAPEITHRPRRKRARANSRDWQH